MTLSKYINEGSKQLCCLRTMPDDLTCWVQGRDVNLSLGSHHHLEDQTRKPGSLVPGWNSSVMTSAGSNGSVGGLWVSDSCHKKSILFHSEGKKKIPLFNFSCHVCNFHVRSYSQLQRSVPFRKQSGSHWITVSFKVPLFQVARTKVKNWLVPALGSCVLAWGTQIWRSDSPWLWEIRSKRLISWISHWVAFFCL